MKPSFRVPLLSRCLASCMAAVGASAWALGGTAGTAQYQAPPPQTSSAPRGSTADALLQGKQRTGQAGKLSHADQQFISKAAAAGQAEVEMGRLGQQQAQNDEVKRFAARMVEDHSRVNAELRSLSTGKGLAWLDSSTSTTTTASAASGPHPALGQVSASARRDLERLQRSSGASFDTEFMKQMVADHRTAVAEFQRAATTATDPEVRSFAQKTLPGLQDHLQQARQLQERIPAAGQR